ncbi:MAG: hypothetical protein HYU36_06710 [Planctomycetes bacterium]|nr:hypothetical protein [Planctomycetota bacterium]
MYWLAGLLALWMAGAVVCEEQGSAGPAATSTASGGGRRYEGGDASRDSVSDGLGGYPIHGFLSTRYRGRWTNGQEDNDTYATLGLDLGNSDKHWATFHFLGRSAWDIDGNKDRTGFYVFDSIDDTYDDNITARLYHAYVDVHQIPFVEIVRAGRQSDAETPVTAYFDGGRIETEDLTFLGLKFGVYGGIPVHLFESSSENDLLGGTYGQIKPWGGGRFRGDWMHLEDKNGLTGAEHQNDLFGVSGWQDMTRYFQLYVNHTRLDEESRDIFARGTIQVPQWDFKSQLSYYELLTSQRDLVIELDPYFASNFELFPYYQVRWLVSKGIGEHFIAEGGLDVRRVWNDRDIGNFNREFDRYFATLSTIDFPLEGSSVSVTGDLWDSPQRDINSIGFDFSHQFTKKFKASLGTYYSLFKYDFLGNQERDDLRTYYVKLTYKLTRHLKVTAGYEFEDDAPDEYHELKVTVQWSF